MTLRHPGEGAISLAVFDLDGVLIDFHPERRLSRLAEMTGLLPAVIHAAIWGSEFEREAEAGAYQTGEAYLAAFNARLGSAVTRAEWTTARAAAMTPRPEMMAFIDELRGHADLALLTNNGALLREALPEVAPEVAARFGTASHASCEFLARKPDPVVYQRLLARYRVPPYAAVFIDDSPDNVAGAITAGLHGIHFTDVPALRSALRHLVPSLVSMDTPGDTEADFPT